MSGERSVLLVAHTGREGAVRDARATAAEFLDSGIDVHVLDDEQDQLALRGVTCVPCNSDSARNCELVVVLGGDGTLLRGAELARDSRTPVLGVNLGHVGFLAEAEREHLPSTVRRIVQRRYRVEERMTIDVDVRLDGRSLWRNWALNEVSVEKSSRQRMVELAIEVDDRPLSRWGCDGIVCATPTGSTAYAFSAGGPIVWPHVEAMLLVPISAHALFARPLVVAPSAVISIELIPTMSGSGVVWCDGRRSVELPGGATVDVRRGENDIRLARLTDAPFADRLVAKFDLPVSGWRGRPRPWLEEAESREDEADRGEDVIAVP